MPLREWLRPPRSLLALYLAGAATAMVCLVWLTSKLLTQTTAVENERARARLESAADRATVASQRVLTELEQIWNGKAPEPADAVVLTGDRNSVHVQPGGRLAFLPVGASDDSGTEAFRAGEWAEFGSQGPAGAVAIYTSLSRVERNAVRAGALARLGRVLRSLGRHAEALDAYAILERTGADAIAGRPPDLFAREARCNVLAETHQREQLRIEADRLKADLVAGRWPISASLWEFLFDEANAWSASPAQVDAPAVALARVAAEFWAGREQGKYTGPVVAFSEPSPAVMLWKPAPIGIRAVIVGPSRLTRIVQEASDGEVQVALVGPDNQSVAGKMGSQLFTRAVPATGLPWNIVTSLIHPGQPQVEARSRARLLLAGLAIVGGLILLSGYFTFRGIRRELATARMQSDFVAAVSHEFRTPLTSIVQFSRMLHEGRAADEGRKSQYYEALVSESERLHRLVERLLSFGRAEAGRYRFEPIDASALTQAVVDQFRRYNAGADVQLVALTPCHVRGDKEMLSIALWNLLDNAVKYSPTGKPIRVDVSRERRMAQIAVHDEGVGIALEDRSRVFDRFVRGAQAATGSKPGTGIGLALVRQVVQAHRGEIRLASEIGRGSTFTIVIPEEAA